MSPPLVLASTSPYRKLLLERLGIPFATAAPGVDEAPRTGEEPLATALRLAREKALAVAVRHPGAVVVGSDQVAVLGDTVMGKPHTHEAALAQLLACGGREVIFHTALCVAHGMPVTARCDNVPTTVRYRNFTPAQAQRYLELEQPYDCAGSAKIEGMGIALLERVESTDPTALIGLPLIYLVTLLQAAGISIPA